MTFALGTGKLSDAATIATVGSEEATLPATNLQTSPLTEKWRTTGLASMYVAVDLGSAKAIDLIALMGANATSAATWQIRGATTEANLTAAPGYDSGAITFWPQTLLDDWDEVYAIQYLASAETWRWWRIDVVDAANPDGYFQAGRLYIASAWAPANVSYGASHQWDSRSMESESLGGQIWVDERRNRRIFEGEIAWLTRAEAMVTLADLQHFRGGKKDILLIEDTAATELQEMSIYGRIVRTGPMLFKKAVPARFTSTLRIEELV